ncbi:putative amino acid permease 7 [Camellia lanceoleosa]|uniref:Amino acid permease 7 n=1 Tax=Camellia lanceoleosa TaxID=1840588 RepID=A0ACC0HDB2_9ERIC|nr:putative amino acid permease 7 [Camellia lanceoleosa]
MKATMKTPSPEKVAMKKTSTAAISITTFSTSAVRVWLSAFGNSTPGNLLTGFGFYEPYWLIDFANACIILHLVGGYQVFSQPLFADLEGLIAEKFPNSRFINKNYILKVPPLPAFRLNLLRLCFRTTYVALTTGLAMLFPYFNQVVGVAGSLNFWPLVVFFPSINVHRAEEYWTLDKKMDRELPLYLILGIWLLAQLAAAKVVATALCKGSGLVGGLHAPSLMIGAAMGAVFGGSAVELINSAMPEMLLLPSHKHMHW